MYYQQALLRTGRKAEAERALTRFKELQGAREKRSVLQERFGTQPADGKVARQMALLDEQLGENDRALQLLEEALRTNPEDREIQSDLTRLWSKMYPSRAETEVIPGVSGGPVRADLPQ
jgi:tetratricopeptide (TPR) repeat protein